MGSWFFLGELFTDLPLPIDTPQTSKHCGSCTACLDICPTKAFNGAFELDARKCISYLTIELKGSIPVNLRPLIGNRVFGCDDCQIICPWNKFAKPTDEQDFKPRHGLDDADMLGLFLWTEQEFEKKTQGSAIRRIGYQRWLRNLAIGLGNSKQDNGKTAQTIAALQSRIGISDLLDEHIHWALERLDAH
jgi:epoxyqueuosine reductase